jgi:hypothetical protein
MIMMMMMMMSVEQLVDRVAGEPEVLRENLNQSHSVHMFSPGLELRPPQWEASN